MEESKPEHGLCWFNLSQRDWLVETHSRRSIVTTTLAQLTVKSVNGPRGPNVTRLVVVVKVNEPEVLRYKLPLEVRFVHLLNNLTNATLTHAQWTAR